MKCPSCQGDGKLKYGYSLVGAGGETRPDPNRTQIVTCDRCCGSGSIPRGQQRRFLSFFISGWVVVCEYCGKKTPYSASTTRCKHCQRSFSY